MPAGVRAQICGPGRRGLGAEEDARERIWRYVTERPDEGDNGIGGAGSAEMRADAGWHH